MMIKIIEFFNTVDKLEPIKSWRGTMVPRCSVNYSANSPETSDLQNYVRIIARVIMSP